MVEPRAREKEHGRELGAQPSSSPPRFPLIRSCSRPRLVDPLGREIVYRELVFYVRPESRNGRRFPASSPRHLRSSSAVELKLTPSCCLTSLQSAGFTHLLALLPVLSHSSSSASTSSRPPSYSSPHLRSLVRFLLFPTPSTRGGSIAFTIVDEDADEEDEVERLMSGDDKGLDVEDDIVELMGAAMEDKRDLRWGVYRESSSVRAPFDPSSGSSMSCVLINLMLSSSSCSLALPLLSILLRPYLPPTSNPCPFSLASNLLVLLQTQAAPIPATQKLLEKQSLLMPGFAKSPFASSAVKGKPAFGEVKAVVEGGDWRDYFESDDEEDDDEDDQPAKKGAKKGGKGAKGKKAATKGEGRASGMSVHQGVWSLESHRAGFTSAWMGLLSLP